MRILLIADREERYLWDSWNESTARALSDVGLVLSAGDLKPAYLEFLVTMLNVPLVYVRGNHDGYYDVHAPEGCMSADGKILDVECDNGTEKMNLRILGLGGSMRYNDNPSDMYTEQEMRARVRRAELDIAKRRLASKLVSNMDEHAPDFDILLTHAPCRGYGDMADLPHMGFECFNDLLKKYSPRLHCYGHVHQEYGEAKRHMIHPSGTLLINSCGHYIIDFVKP